MVMRFVVVVHNCFYIVYHVPHVIMASSVLVHVQMVNKYGTIVLFPRVLESTDGTYGMRGIGRVGRVGRVGHVRCIGRVGRVGRLGRVGVGRVGRVGCGTCWWRWIREGSYVH
jgi:hypothetical protein